MKDQIKNLAVGAAKFGGTFALVWGVAWAFVSMSPEGEVQQAEADVFELIPRDALPDDAFGRLMTDNGIKPRSFDLNGNTVYFGHLPVRNEPQELLQKFQRDFVERGINSKVYTRTPHQMGMTRDLEKPGAVEELKQAVAEERAPVGFQDTPEAKAMRDAILTGEIVPYHNSKEYVSMGGIVPKVRGLEGEEDVWREWEKTDRGAVDMEGSIKGFRFMDFTKEKDSTTTVTASWSENDFDYHKMKPGYPVEDLSIDQNVPSCVGCVRTFRLDGMTDNDPFTTNQFFTRNHIDSVEQFYTRAMAKRGWARSDAQNAMEKLQRDVPSLQNLDGRVMFLEREGIRLNLMLHNMEGGGTMITSTTEREPLPVLEH